MHSNAELTKPPKLSGVEDRRWFSLMWVEQLGLGEVDGAWPQAAAGLRSFPCYSFSWGQSATPGQVRVLRAGAKEQAQPCKYISPLCWVIFTSIHWLRQVT